MPGLKDGFPCGKNQETLNTSVLQCGGDQSWSVPECSLELNMSQEQRDMEFPANPDVIMYFPTMIQYIFKLSSGHPKYLCTTE